MRFNLVLQITGAHRTLPINYQYPLHSWIYRVIQQSNATFSHFLHEKGYSATRVPVDDDHRVTSSSRKTATADETALVGKGAPSFKLFTFSQLTGKPFRIFKEEQRIAFYGSELSLGVSFWLPEAAEHFIRGLFMGQRFRLGDSISQVDLEVVRIEAMPRPLFSEVMHYRTISPVVVSVRTPDRKHPQYIAPDDDRYPTQLLRNLLHKAEAVKLEVSATDRGDVSSEEWQLAIQGPFRKKGILVKQHTPMQNKIIGYTFDFALTAPFAIQQLAYYAGLGEDNSMGFGFLAVK